jgi:membrane peptidoglycan carboxypeptidase
LRNKPFEWPSLRRWLITLHLDLLSIHERCHHDYLDGELSLLEELIVVLEDHRFFSHFGVDVWSLFREIFKATVGQSHGGASTIDMQLVRTITGFKERTLKRKCYEMLLAVLIQQRYDKWTILRSYMRVAYLGHRLKGFDTAARAVFGKSTYGLNFTEAAELASMLVYPRPSNEVLSWRLKLERRKSYAEVIYPRYKESFKKLPSRKIGY